MLSNCLVEAIKGTIRTNGSLYQAIPNSDSERGVPHFIWSDGDKYKHFTFNKKKKMKHWWQFIIFDGRIDDFPNKYLKEVRLKKIF